MLPILAIISVTIGLQYGLELFTTRANWNPEGAMAACIGMGVLLLAVDAMMARR